MRGILRGNSRWIIPTLTLPMVGFFGANQLPEMTEVVDALPDRARQVQVPGNTVGRELFRRN